MQLVRVEVSLVRKILSILVAIEALAAVGCGCGGALVPGATDAGIVTFAAPLGQSELVEIPIEANSGDETFVSGSVAGAGAEAFQVLSTFPLVVNAGTPATVRVQFAPQQPGTYSASLVLDTASMGDSTIPLEGTAAVGDGG